MRKRLALVFAALAVLPVASRADDPRPGATIVDVARRAGKFKTLVRALEATGLDQALAGEGPFTLFAPSDEAFAALPEGALDALLADRARLARVLKYHVARSRKLADEVVQFTAAGTLEGSKLPIAVEGEQVRVGGARVVKADVLASNGVIHVIDTVLLPPGGGARFPAIEAKSLARVEYRLPGDLAGEKNLCLVAFQRWHQEDIDTWLEWLADAPIASTPGFAYYEMPTLQSGSKLFQRFLDDGMRAGIPSRAARARTITLWTDKEAFLRDLDIADDQAIQALLVDREGHVLWRAEGRYTKEKGKALETAVQGARRP